uniref:Uncharacterized protein n=1 Tax=Arundo donax TaxID=35708 RepID=A0A0A8Y2H3_ARUDO
MAERRSTNHHSVLSPSLRLGGSAAAREREQRRTGRAAREWRLRGRGAGYSA